MNLTPHLLAGALVTNYVKTTFLAITLAFFSHYLLDSLPHEDYGFLLKNIGKKRWSKAHFEFLLIFIDFSIGVTLILIFGKNLILNLIGGFFGILPDILFFLNLIFINTELRIHDVFHKRIQHLYQGRIPFFWKNLSQIAITALILLFLIKY